MNQLDLARLNIQKSYQLSVLYNNPQFRGIALTNLGNIYAKMGQHATAMGYYKKSLQDLEAVHNNDAICEVTLGMANLYKKEGESDTALQYARQSLTTADRGGFTKHLLSASSFLSVYYENKSMIDSAFVYQKIAIAAKDSLFSQEKIREAQSLSFAEQIRQQEIKEERVVASETRKNHIQMSAIGVFIPIFLGIILWFGRRKAKPKTLAYIGLFGLLMLFEFITMLIHPYIEEWTKDLPILTLLMLVGVASFLLPLHHKLEHSLREKLSHKK
jgi:tetratricopeptide (TPR) repeat protein